MLTRSTNGYLNNGASGLHIISSHVCRTSEGMLNDCIAFNSHNGQRRVYGQYTL